MRKVNYEIDLGKLGIEDPEEDLQKKMFENLLLNGLRSKYQNGVKGLKGRILSRVLFALDGSSDGWLEVEESGFELLKEVFCDDGCSFDPAHWRAVCQYQERLEGSEKVNGKAKSWAAEEKVASA